METEPELLGQVLASRPHSSDSKPASISNLEQFLLGPLVKVDALQFGMAIAYLCAMKRTANLTDQQLDTWHAVLGGFREEIINAAVIEICLTDNRFPELGDLYKICFRNAVKRGDRVIPYKPSASNEEFQRPLTSEIQEIADRLGLKV